MKTKILLSVMTFLIALIQINGQSNATDQSYGEWQFVQSDKAIQYRFKKEKQEADLLFLKMQFRLNKTDEIFCATSDCLGYLWFFNFSNDYVKIDNHYMVYNSFEGIKDVPQTIIIKLMKYEDAEVYWNETDKAVMRKDNYTGDVKKLALGWSCVDNILASNSSHRCSSNFNKEQAEILK